MNLGQLLMDLPRLINLAYDDIIDMDHTQVPESKFDTVVLFMEAIVCLVGYICLYVKRANAIVDV
jgi:hypothetical protein